MAKIRVYMGAKDFKTFNLVGNRDDAMALALQGEPIVGTFQGNTAIINTAVAMSIVFLEDSAKDEE